MGPSRASAVPGAADEDGDGQARRVAPAARIARAAIATHSGGPRRTAGGRRFFGVEVEEAEVTFEWDSPEHFMGFMKEIAPPIHALMEGHSDEEKQATWEAIAEAARGQADADGKVSLTNLVLLASGEA